MNLIRKISHFFKNIPRSYRLGLFAVIGLNLLVKAWLVFHFPIFVDEVSTYYDYTSRGIFTSVTYYPTPNNHILHSVLTNLTYHLPFDKTLMLRLPNFLVNILTVIVFFGVFSRLTNYKTALFFTGIFSFTYPLLYYGYVARGYSLVVLFYLIVFYASMQIIRQAESHRLKKYFLLLSVATVAGIYTMPSFLYAYASSLLFLIYALLKAENRQALKELLLSAVLSGMAVLILYAPVLYYSGWEALASNQYVKPAGFTDNLIRIPYHFNKTAIFFTYFPLYISFPFFALLVYAVYKRHWNRQTVFAVFTIVMAPVILMIHKVIPFPRTWIYLIVPGLYLLAVYLQDYISRMKPKKYYLLLSLLMGTEIVAGIYQIKKIDHVSFEIRDTTDYILQQDIKKIYISEKTYLGSNLQYMLEDYPGIEIFYNKDSIRKKDINNYQIFLLDKRDAGIVDKDSLLQLKHVFNETGWYHFLYEKP